MTENRIVGWSAWLLGTAIFAFNGEHAFGWVCYAVSAFNFVIPFLPILRGLYGSR